MPDPAVEHGWVTVDSPDASEVNAGNLNDHVIDYELLAEGLGSVWTGCLAQRTTTQAFVSSPTRILFTGTDIYDPDGWHDPAGANPGRLTCPAGKGGRLFLAWAQLEWNPSGAQMYIQKNGSEIVGMSNAGNYASDTSAIVYLDDTDYVELWATIGSGGSILTDAPTRFGVIVGGTSLPTQPVIRASSLVYASRNFR